MSVLSKDKNQVKLYYHSGNSLGKQTLGYAKATEKAFMGIDLAKESITGTQWAELASGLDIRISDLIDTKHPDFKEEYGNDEVVMDEHDWLKVLEKYPEAMAFPIAVVGTNFHAVHNPSDFTRLLEPDSAGLDKPYNKQKK